MRPGISDGITKIMVSIKNLLNVHKKGEVTIGALQAIKSIAVAICPGEEALMAELVPSVLYSTKDTGLASHALAALSSMSSVFFAKLHGILFTFF